MGRFPAVSHPGKTSLEFLQGMLTNYSRWLKKTPFIFPPGRILTSHTIQELMLSYCGAGEDS